MFVYSVMETKKVCLVSLSRHYNFCPKTTQCSFKGALCSFEEEIETQNLNNNNNNQIIVQTLI